MAFCQKCGNELQEGTTFCSNCGTPVGATATAPVISEYDHTADYDLADIRENKALVLFAYLTGIFGVAYIYLGAKDSKYAMFHAREIMKCTVLIFLLAIVSGILAITVIVPIAAAICMIIIYVCKIIQFFNVCADKAIETPIVRNFKFLG